jgi:hypothetical protein
VWLIACQEPEHLALDEILGKVAPPVPYRIPSIYTLGWKETETDIDKL